MPKRSRASKSIVGGGEITGLGDGRKGDLRRDDGGRGGKGGVGRRNV